MEAKAVIDRSGIGCEPASAASLAGLRKLVQQGVIDREMSAVCLLTGNLLKDTEAIEEVHLPGSKSAAPARSHPIQHAELVLHSIEAYLRQGGA
jgi:threonine synthase